VVRTAAYHIRADEAAQIARAAQPVGRTLVIVIATTAIFALFVGSQGNSNLVTVAIVMAATGTILTFALHWLMRRTISQWIDRHAVCPAYLEWDDAGFRSGGCVHGEEGRWPWSAVSAVKESSDFLILQSGRCMQIVPKRALRGEAEADFLRRLAALKTR
jgi:hypothetical protein